MDKNVTQQEMATALFVDRVTVSQWEQGTRDIKAGNIVSAAAFLEVSTDYLLGVSEARTTNSDLQAIIKATGLSQEAVIELSTMPELGVPASDEHIRAMDRQAETMRYRKIIDLLLTNIRGKEALKALAQYYYATPLDSKTLTAFKLEWNLPNLGGIWFDTTTVTDETLQETLLQIAIYQLKQIKIDKESADEVSNRIKMREEEKGKPLTSKEKQREWELYALEKSPVPYHPYERDIIYKEGSDNG
jgi:transcriptional regulator with XRE-family HTH domain